MAKLEDEIDGLYRLPPGDFTAARNALAKALGPAAAHVKTLEKPQAAAWAVNQLYWHRRAAYDSLIKASLAMRTAHTNMLSGRKADVPQAETAHRDAMRTATQAIRELAKAAGESLSGATLDAIAETLGVLPTDETPGRLTRPLKPKGLEALMGIGIQAGRALSAVPRAADTGAAQAKPSTAERAAAKKEAAEDARQRKVLEKALRAAEAAEREAEAAMAEATKAVAKVERDYEAVRDRLQFLEKQRSDAEQELHKRRDALQQAVNARTQAAQDLRKY